MKQLFLALFFIQLSIFSTSIANDSNLKLCIDTQNYSDSLQKQQKRVVDIKGIDVYPENYAKKLTQRAARTFASKYSKNFISTFILTHTVEANGKYRELFATESLLQSYDFNQKSEKLHFLIKMA
ncbi:MAG: hypothetical protein R3Y50_09440 [Rikenellaceae bacterium]